ncbi:hypothetical protein VNI00_001936 [Paramarasmius palmivorus]|uniref:Uncharacterized protein n=1 Tax=Paramarasmius palmivorus TaxID=297713 RepID=A0AAW0E1Y9_9AGAR
MAISFSPALGEAVSISVAPWHISPTGLVQVRVNARVPVAEFRQLEERHAKVQVWSDFPHPAQRSEGQWGELDFELEEEESTASQSRSSSEAHVVLGSFDKQEEADDDVIRLSLKVAVPFSGQSAKQYSFTYRIVHPSGRVEWLGSFGRNGTLRLESSSLGDSSLALQGEEWNLNGSTCEWNQDSSQKDSPSTQIAKVSANQENWSVWALGRDSSLSRYTCEEASILFLVPRANTFAFLCPKIVAVASSPDSSLSISSSGEIQASGSGSVILQPFHPSTSSFIEGVLSYSGSPLVSCAKHSGDAILSLNSSSSKILPVRVAVVPLAQENQPSEVNFSSAELASYLGPQSPSQLSISNPDGDVIFVDSEGQNGSSTDISFSLSPTGGEFSLAPVYPLMKPRAGSNDIKLSILTKHTPVASLVVSDEVLPTPPPSPQLRPIAHLTPQRSQITGLGASQGNDSNLSISDIGIPSRAESPVLPSTSTHTTRPTSKLAQEILTPSSSSSLTRSSSDQSSNRVRRRPAYLVACMRHFFFATSVFFMIFFRRVFPFLPFGRRTASTASSYSEPETRRTVTGNTEEVDGDGVEDETAQADERTPLLSGERSGEPIPDAAPSEEAAKSEPIPVPEAEPDSTKVSGPSTSQGTASPTSVLVFDLLEELGGNHKLVFQGFGDLSEAEKIQFDVNGEPVKVLQVEQKGETSVVVELDWTKAGRLRARYPL